MIEAEWWDYDDADELSDAVASDIEFIIDSALDARGDALIALPGGDLAAPVYARLAKAKLNWKRVTILPTGDRLVAPTDAASVVGMLARTFLPIGARVIPLIGDAKAAYKKAGLDADERLGAMKWPLDLAWLTVDADGGTGALVAGPDLDAAITAPAKAIGLMPAAGNGRPRHPDPRDADGSADAARRASGCGGTHDAGSGDRGGRAVDHAGRPPARRQRAADRYPLGEIDRCPTAPDSV